MDGETTVRIGEAYVSGALTALDDGARTRLFYELLAEVAEAVGLRLPSAPRQRSRGRRPSRRARRV